MERKVLHWCSESP